MSKSAMKKSRTPFS